MFSNLQALGYGLVVFAIIIGVGSVVLQNFAQATANCNSTSTYNLTNRVCSNLTGGGYAVQPSTASVNTNYLNDTLGTTGLAGWTPAIIAISVGLMFLGAFMVRGAKRQ